MPPSKPAFRPEVMADRAMAVELRLGNSTTLGPVLVLSLTPHAAAEFVLLARRGRDT